MSANPNANNNSSGGGLYHGGLGAQAGSSVNRESGQRPAVQQPFSPRELYRNGSMSLHGYNPRAIGGSLSGSSRSSVAVPGSHELVDSRSQPTSPFGGTGSVQTNSSRRGSGTQTPRIERKRELCRQLDNFARECRRLLQDLSERADGQSCSPWNAHCDIVRSLIKLCTMLVLDGQEPPHQSELDRGGLVFAQRVLLALAQAERMQASACGLSWPASSIARTYGSDNPVPVLIHLLTSPEDPTVSSPLHSRGWIGSRNSSRTHAQSTSGPSSARVNSQRHPSRWMGEKGMPGTQVQAAAHSSPSVAESHAHLSVSSPLVSANRNTGAGAGVSDHAWQARPHRLLLSSESASLPHSSSQSPMTRAQPGMGGTTPRSHLASLMTTRIFNRRQSKQEGFGNSQRQTVSDGAHYLGDSSDEEEHPTESGSEFSGSSGRGSRHSSLHELGLGRRSHVQSHRGSVDSDGQISNGRSSSILSKDASLAGSRIGSLRRVNSVSNTSSFAQIAALPSDMRQMLPSELRSLIREQENAAAEPFTSERQLSRSLSRTSLVNDGGLDSSLTSTKPARLVNMLLSPRDNLGARNRFMSPGSVSPRAARTPREVVGQALHLMGTDSDPALSISPQALSRHISRTSSPRPGAKKALLHFDAGHQTWLVCRVCEALLLKDDFASHTELCAQLVKGFEILFSRMTCLFKLQKHMQKQREGGKNWTRWETDLVDMIGVVVSAFRRSLDGQTVDDDLHMESSARLCEWRDEFQRISEQMYSGSAATEAVSECVKSCGHFCAQLLREIQFARSRILRVASKWMQQRGDGNEASRIDHDGCYSLTLRECHKLICKFSPEFERLFDDDLQLRGPTLSEFEIIKPISCGAFGRVFVARKKSTGDLFALKVVRKSDLDSDGIRASLMLERDLLSHSLKRGSVRLFSSFRTRTKLVLVMEFVSGGDVYSLLCNLGFLDEAVTKQYIAELVVALDSMHKIGIVHLDVKPDNMLVDKDGHVVLTDFGLSRCIRRSKLNIDLTASDSLLEMSSTGTFLVHQFLVQTQGIRTAKEVVGTPDYLAPEVLRGEGPAFAADFWSVGVIVFEFVMGLPPFHDASMDMIFDNVVNCRYEQPVVPDEMSADVNDLMHCLLDPNPETRLGARGAEEIMQHPFFADIDWNLLRSMQPKFIPELQSEDDTSYFQSRKPVANLTAEIDGDDNTSSGHASRSPALHQEHGSSATAREAVTAAAALSPTGRMENSESGGRVAKGPSGHIVKPHLNLFDSVRIPVLECAERKSTSPAANRPTSRGRARAGGNQSSGDRNSPNTPAMSRGRPSSKQTQPRRLQLIDGDELNKVSDFAEFSHICVANLAARNMEVLRASQPPQSSTDTMVGLW